MSRIDLNGIAVAYEDEGTSADVIVLVHGHPFNRSMWRPQFAALTAAGWRAIAPDLRGYGDTTVVPGKTTLDAFANDLAALLDALGVHSAIVAGLSMGGQIAMEFARLHRSRLRGLVLAATFSQVDTQEVSASRVRMADRLLREGMGPYADETLAKMIAPHNITALPAIAEHVLTMMRTTLPEGAAAALRGRAERPPYDAVLAGLDVPALIVGGDEDVFTSRADAERMHGLLKRSTLAWIEGAGHMPNLERPTVFNAALVRFLESLRPRTLPT
jgi:3-oxoadipate enol-lactonase